MNRSIAAVLFGTFTLRFSTGLTGGLLVYYLAALPQHGGEHVSSLAVGILAAAYFAAELTLSPVFGVLADRLGAHRVMQWGPVFGAVAVVMTALTVNLPVIGLTRGLEGAAAGASIPSILGYIALATSVDEALRGRTVARFEAATLAGIGIGVVVAGPAWELLARWAFVANAGVYAISFVIYRWGVAELSPEQVHGPEVGDARHHRERPFDFSRYRRVVGSPRVWLLAPTWIALNAVVGAWTTQSVFQLIRQPPAGKFQNQWLMGQFDPISVSIGLGVALLVFFAGLIYWGNRFKAIRRTSIIVIGIAGGLLMMGAIFVLNHSGGMGPVIQVLLAAGMLAGLFVLAGGTPAALGLLADISESHPTDRGAIMGLYSVFLAVGQIVGALVGGGAAEWMGVDGLLVASLGLLVVALLPVRSLRASEHLVGTTEDHRADGHGVRIGSDDA